jgi:DNA-binding LacI/PurR family transcriptional regulator
MAEPLYRTIANDLLAEIRSGRLKAGDRLPTEADLERRYSVSRITAARALRELQNLGLANRVQGSGSYVQEGAAAPGGALRFVAAIFPELERNSIPEILAGIEAECAVRRILVTYHNSRNDPRLERQIIEQLHSQDCQGILLFPCFNLLANAALYSQLSLARHPLVMLDRSIDFLNLPLVACDNAGSMAALCRHVIQQGHRRIGFLCNSIEAISSEQERFQGYGQALMAAGLPVDAGLVWRCLPQAGPDSATLLPSAEERSGQVRAALDYYRSLDDPPTCVMAVNDLLAIALEKALLSSSLRIPQDMAVTGFDDVEASQHMDVPLTTVGQPFRSIGQEAARWLLAPPPATSGGHPAIRIPGGLRLRASC